MAELRAEGYSGSLTIDDIVVNRCIQDCKWLGNASVLMVDDLTMHFELPDGDIVSSPRTRSISVNADTVSQKCTERSECVGKIICNDGIRIGYNSQRMEKD